MVVRRQLLSALAVFAATYMQQVQLFDNQIQLDSRLENIDKLDLSLLSSLDLDSPDWPAEGSDTSLRQVLFIHRHGDRTPTEFPPRDELAKEPFWSFHGQAQLTNRGKARLFLLGVMIRARYDKFLDRSRNKNQRISRSSGSLRCIESAQVFLSGFLALHMKKSRDASRLIWDSTNKLSRLWQPASVQSVPASIDGMLAQRAYCKESWREYNNVIGKTDFVKRIDEEYKAEAELLNRTMGFVIDRYYKWPWADDLITVEKSYFPDKMKPEIIAAQARIREAASLATIAYISTLKSRQLRGGLLLSDMINNMKSMREYLTNSEADIESSELKKFVHYSAHDLNLIILLSMLGHWSKNSKNPDFGSNIIIELHEEENEWFVKLFYMPSVPMKPIELHLPTCGPKCKLDEFERIMQPYLIKDWETWMEKCGNNLSMIDPYKPDR